MQQNHTSQGDTFFGREKVAIRPGQDLRIPNTIENVNRIKALVGIEFFLIHFLYISLVTIFLFGKIHAFCLQKQGKIMRHNSYKKGLSHLENG
jgi:hypothetical protein